MRAIATFALLLVPPQTRGPGDVDTLNKFAVEYNRYAEELRGGVVDVKQWARVEEAWKAVR